MQRIVIVPVLFMLSLLAGCPRGPSSILTDQPQAYGTYRYAAVSTSSTARETIETTLDRKHIVTRYAPNSDRVAYVVREGANQALFDKVAFQPLEKATLVVHVARVSNINGWGTGANGEIHRNHEVKLEFSRAQLANAFALLQRLETAPLETIAATWPGSLNALQASRPVHVFEVGYELQISTRLITGNPFDAETRVDLYGSTVRSGYTRL